MKRIMPMTEQEFLSRVQHGRCCPELMSEGLNDLLCSVGMYDSARVVVRWIDTREEMQPDWFGEHEAPSSYEQASVLKTVPV
jgi:hypothetical protein